jgi:NADH:ubiquinone oxidoreductase subunit H
LSRRSWLSATRETINYRNYPITKLLNRDHAAFFILVSVIKSLIVLVVLLTAVAYTVWLERKVVGHMQNRWGPTRVGPFGLLQPAADG